MISDSHMTNEEDKAFGALMESMTWIYQLFYSKTWILVFNGNNCSYKNTAFISVSWWYFACQFPWKGLFKRAALMFYWN